MDWRIPLFKIYWDEKDIAEVVSLLKKGTNWAIGPAIEEFEKRASEYIGVTYATTFNSGTSALHALLLAYGIGQGDEVIVPSFTFIATANAPLFVGAKPVFAEIEEVTYGLDPQDVEAKINSKTKAIIPIHYGGGPCLIRELQQIAHKHNILLIEDAAEAFGAGIDGKRAGTFGDAAILSFCQNKVITTGEGGAVVTNSKEVCERLRLLRSHGRLETEDYFSSTEHMDYITLGYNFRMSNIAAVLGVAQLEKVDKIIKMRRNNALNMNRKLSDIEGIIIPKAPDGFFHVYQMYTVRLKGVANLRDNLIRYLSKRGIMSKVYFHPVHLTEFYQREFCYRRGELPLTEEIASEVITVPMYPMLTEEEMDYIAEQIKDFFAGGGQ